MCRWLSYLGEPLKPHRFLYEQKYSLIEQSQHARKAKTMINGDGFGFGWYGDDGEPGRFRDILPAWSDENLLSLSRLVRSRLFMAHVRAATDTTISRTNCHPFIHERAMFIHNGQIGGYVLLRRQIENLIPNELYPYRLGSSDSEALFLYLESLLRNFPFSGAVERMIEKIEAIMRNEQVKEPFRFTSAYSDGEKIYVARYATDNKAPSLYYKREGRGWIVVSEPLDSDAGIWRAVPLNHTMIVADSKSEPVITAL